MGRGNEGGKVKSGGEGRAGRGFAVVRKTAATAAVVAVVSLFGWHFGPERNTAEAKVYERLFAYTRAMPEYLFDDEATSEPRKVTVNNNVTRITVGQTDDSVSKVLDFYEDQFEPPEPELIDEESIEKVEDPALRDRLLKQNKLLRFMAKGQHFRIQKRHLGFWGAFELRTKDVPLYGPDFVEKHGEEFLEALETGELGKIGSFRIVMAMRREGMRSTKIVNLWTEKDFNVNNLTPDPFGDTPGRDVADVPRYPGSKRRLSVEQENRSTVDTLALYESRGSVVGHILFYQSRMKDAGWSVDENFREAMRSEEMENLLFYTREGRECTIHIAEEFETGTIVTTVIDRTTT